MSFGSLPSVLSNGGGVAISVIGGTGLFADGTAAAPSISFAAETNKGFYSPAANQVGLSLNGGLVFTFRQDGGVNPYILGAGGQFMQFLGAGGVNITAAGTNQNITLTPSGVGHVASTSSIRSTGAGAGAMTGSGIEMQFSAGIGSILAYNRTGGAYLPLYADGLRLHLNAGSGGQVLIGTSTDSGALLQIGTNTTTSAGGMVFGTDTFLFRSATGNLTLQTTGTSALLKLLDTVANVTLETANGDFYLSTRNAAKSIFLRSGNGVTALTLDASQNATFAGNTAVGASKFLGWDSRAVMYSPADGIIRLSNNGATDFTRLQFGGTTTSFPALARTGTTLSAVLADGSAYAPFSCSALSLFGALKLAVPYVGGVGAATGYLTVQDSTGTTYKIPVLA